MPPEEYPPPLGFSAAGCAAGASGAATDAVAAGAASRASGSTTATAVAAGGAATAAAVADLTAVANRAADSATPVEATAPTGASSRFWAPFIERCMICATSRTSISSRASPDCLRAVTASESMVMQNGQAVDTMSGSSSRASSTRSTLIRLPIRSSIHIRAPPAPQQKPRSLQRCISSVLIPGTPASTSRGGV